MSKKGYNVMKYRKTALICLFVSIPLNIISYLMGLIGAYSIQTILTYPGVLLLICFMLISIILWRCPRCKERLPMRFDSKNNVDEAGCPYCGMNFLYDEVDD